MKTMPPLLPGGLPVVGHLFEFMKNRTSLFKRGLDSLGPIFAIQLLNQRVAVLIGPEYQQVFFQETDKKLTMQKPYAFLKSYLAQTLQKRTHGEVSGNYAVGSTTMA
jgi:sterol 14alpha-demethylase